MTKILAVDDEPLYQHLLKVNLEKEGYEVITASNGEEALEMVSSRHPDLVIMDIMMPKLDGLTTSERIRQFSNIPIVILTARGEEQDRVRGLEYWGRRLRGETIFCHRISGACARRIAPHE